MSTYVPGPLSGPAPLRNRSRNPLWRFRRLFFVLAIMGGAALAVIWSFASQVELTGDDFESLNETTYICTAEIGFECGPDTAANEMARDAEDRIVVPYEEIPDVVIQAVIATEDKSFFDHQGVDPIGLSRAVYQTAKRKATGTGSVQGGSTITQQYIKLTSGDAADSLSRKGREVVRAIKLEQELADELGSKEAAKQQILERYLNRIWFGRRSYGVAAAARNYFDKDLDELTVPEAAYLAGLIRNPIAADPIQFPDEAARRRTVTLGLMEEQAYITAEQRTLADQDDWSTLVREEANVEGIGDVKWSNIGSQYFVRAVRDQMSEIFPQQQYYQRSMRVYTTLDPGLQELAYTTVNATLDPNNPDMPLGALVSLDDQGRVVAMMAGADWNSSEVNLVTGQGGSGFQAGSTMKPVVLAEFIEQGFSLESLFDNKPVKYPECDNWSPGGGTNNPVNRHKTVKDAMRWSRNSIFAQMIMQVGIEPSIDMGHRLGITSDIPAICSIVLGSNQVNPLEMASVYSTFKHEGVRLDPVLIDRIEDADGNVLCYHPTKAGDCDGSASANEATRQGEQAVEGSVARQVNTTLVDVAANGTGTTALLVAEDGTVRATAGKTGTTNDARDAWFTGFSCKLTTSVWVGYPGDPNEVGVRYMSDRAIAEANVQREEAGVPPWPLISELFPGLDEIHGGDVPAQIWHDFMMGATANDEPCEIPTEQSSADQHVLGLELMTTLVPCEAPDPALVAQAQAQQQAESTSTSEPAGDGGGGGGDGGGDDEGALGVLGSRSSAGSGFGVFRLPTYSLRGPILAQDGNNGNGNGGNGGDNNGGGGVIVPTTEPCLPIDLDGNVIDDATTTTIDPAGPSTMDPNSTTTETTDGSSTSETQPSSSSTSEPEQTTQPPSTEAPTTEPTETTESTEDAANTNNGNGRGRGGNNAADDPTATTAGGG